MGEEKCGDCRSWEEEIYWTRFQFLHFSQVLRLGFDQQLAIPQHFCKNLKKKLPETVTLRGPSGSTWEVGLNTNDCTVFFSNGWQEFVKDHSLKEKDIVLFKYNGDSRFDVLVFDGESLCEKASSYFVRKCGHREYGSCCCQTKRKMGESSVEGSPPHNISRDASPPRNISRDASPEKFSDDTAVKTPPLRQPSPSKSPQKKTRLEMEPGEPSHDWLSGRNEEPSSFFDGEFEPKPDIGQLCLNPNVVYNVPCISSRRLITAEEKQNVLLLAQAALTSEGFIQVMKPTHVNRRFFMVIPSVWMVRHLQALLEEDVILRVKENTWRTRFFYQKSRNCGGLSAGWKHFALDNKLQECDVCVFEPGSPINNSVVLDVNIFRVASITQDW